MVLAGMEMASFEEFRGRGTWRHRVSRRGARLLCLKDLISGVAQAHGNAGKGGGGSRR